MSIFKASVFTFIILSLCFSFCSRKGKRNWNFRHKLRGFGRTIRGCKKSLKALLPSSRSSQSGSLTPSIWTEPSAEDSQDQLNSREPDRHGRDFYSHVWPDWELSIHNSTQFVIHISIPLQTLNTSWRRGWHGSKSGKGKKNTSSALFCDDFSTLDPLGHH